MATQDTRFEQEQRRFEQEQRRFEQVRRRRRFPLAENRQQDWLNVLLAIWLFISPWVLQFGFGVQPGPAGSAGLPAPTADVLYAAAWNAWILGIVVFLIALSASGRRAAWQASGHEWVVLLLGIWIFVAPWVLGFADVGNANGGLGSLDHRSAYFPGVALESLGPTGSHKSSVRLTIH